MRITTKILTKRSRCPLATAVHLDMSGLGIGTVENLEHCHFLQSLDLSNNCLEEFDDFDCCKQLWRINLSNNKISSLTAFSKVYALGSLNLANNNLSWRDLENLQSVYILDLQLHGNAELENDTYYRLHVINCLPKIWMLDGRLITSAERLQVRQFFEDSALSDRPVRHKLRQQNVINNVKNKNKTVYGDRSNQFAFTFACNESHNSDTDRRRLEFLTCNVQEDLNVELCSLKKMMLNKPSLPTDWLVDIISNRSQDKEKCNMLLILLIASLEFKVPIPLLEHTLKVAKLNPLFGVDTSQILKLKAKWRVEVICLLVSACKLDRDIKRPDSTFTSGGLYDRLYLCLYHAVAHLVALITERDKKIRKSDRFWIQITY